MYKIYINQTIIQFADLTEFVKAELHPEHLKAKYFGGTGNLLNYIDNAEKSTNLKSITIFAKDKEQLIKDFFSLFKIVKAAGGRVANGDGDILMIYRRGFWDLPKGKIDDGEDPPTAALREVEEETGVAQLVLGEQLSTTYHTYRNRKGKRVLKPTYWFGMKTNHEDLVPQTEEDIERAEWRKMKEVLNAPEPLYRSLRHLLEQI